MSFTSEIKSELCQIEASTCCKISECYGILLFGRAFSVDFISFSTENEEVLDRLVMLLARCYSVMPNIMARGRLKDFFTVSINDKAKCLEILTSLGYYGFKKGDRFIKSQNVEDDCCKSAFLRGAFLSCGMVTNPDKDYHAEFVVHNKILATEFFEFLKECGLSPSISKRGNDTIIYFKESGNIEDLLTTINATHHTLELAGIKVYKDMRNHYNRLNNCETANITKTVNASVAQVRAITKLEKAGIMDKLSDELKMAATLRKNNPDSSLKELAELSDNLITRSGLNHRLNKLIKLAENLNE